MLNQKRKLLMKKSTKHWKAKLFCLTLLSVMLYACQGDLYEKNEGHETETIDFGVIDARNWFEATTRLMEPNEVLLRTSDGLGKTMELNPLLNWNIAELSNNEAWEVVELPWEYKEITQIFALGEVWQHALASNSVPENVTRLVIIRNRETEETHGFKMRIAPTLDYLLRSGERLKTNTYLDRDSNLSGMVVFYTLEGLFINGWRYQDGEIIAELTGKKRITTEEDSNTPTTRGFERDTGWDAPFLLDEFVVMANLHTNGRAGLNSPLDGWLSLSNHNFVIEPIGNDGGGGGGSAGTSTNSQALTARITATSFVELAGTATFTVTTSPVTTRARNIVIEMGRDGHFTQLQSGTSWTHSRRLLNPGIWEARARVTLDDGRTLPSVPVRVTVQYPTVTTIQNNPTVRSAMSATWAQTKAAADRNGRQEFGFWIYANTIGGSVTFETGMTQSGPRVGCDGHPTINPGVSTLNITLFNPLVGGTFPVAHFHTHTPLSFCPNSDTRYPVGPSPADISWAASRGVPGLVYDYVGTNMGGGRIGIRGGHDINAPARVWTFGPQSRIAR